MAINKVEYGDETLIDLTNDTVSEDTVLEGVSFHSADGEERTGKVVVADVIDNLTSESSEDALSANQGRVLNEKIEDIKLFKFPNAIIHGEPTINNGQISDFSTSNYLSLPFEFDVTGKAFEILIAFTTKADVTTAQNLFGSNYCIASYIANGKLTFRVSSNGTSWNAIDYTTKVSINPNTTYYFKFTFDRLTYKISYSTDGVNFTQDGLITSTLSPKPGTITIGVGNGMNNPFLGIINFNKFEIRINNAIYWEGMDDVGLATRLAIDLENIDEVGIERIKEIAGESSVPENIVLHGPSEEEVEVPPIDADKLGGELPEYYAKQSDINATNQAVNNINVYVGEDKKLHFVNGEGADSVLPFSSGGGWKLIKYGYPMNKGTGSPDIISHTVTEKGTYVLFACQAGRGNYFPSNVPIVSYSGNVENILYQYTKDKWQSCMVVNANIGDTLSVTIYGQPYPLLFSYIAKVSDIQSVSLYSEDYNQNDNDILIKNITEEGRYLVLANIGGSSIDNADKTNLIQTDTDSAINMDICSLLYNPTDNNNPYRNFMKSYLVDIKNGEYFKITSKISGYSRKITVILKCV